MICTHNTFTYLPPIKFWMRILIPFAKCQNKTVINSSYMADIRVRNYNDKVYISHGPVIYINLHDALAYMYLYTPIRNIRLLIEGKCDEKFINKLKVIMELWHNFDFYCGRHKKGWKKLIDIPDIDVIQYVGSMKSWYGKICPWLWTKLNRKKLDKLKNDYRHNKQIALFDFI